MVLKKEEILILKDSLGGVSNGNAKQIIEILVIVIGMALVNSIGNDYPDGNIDYSKMDFFIIGGMCLFYSVYCMTLYIILKYPKMSITKKIKRLKTPFLRWYYIISLFMFSFVCILAPITVIKNTNQSSLYDVLVGSFSILILLTLIFIKKIAQSRIKEMKVGESKKNTQLAQNITILTPVASVIILSLVRMDVFFDNYFVFFVLGASLSLGLFYFAMVGAYYIIMVDYFG
ncbi:MAG: hypothetical protein OEY93_09990 [Anaerolineae bacterium]|nr:hypothetical protein [Anaerolineae bacterium]